MENNYSFFLFQKFPELEFAKEADKWLASIWPKGSDRKKLLTQFEERRITKIQIISMISTAGLRIGEDNNFCISLNDVNNEREDAEGLGHEIGHTFHFDLTKNPPMCSIPDSENISKELFWLIENFCDVFSQEWLNINGRELIEKCSRNERNLI